MTIASPSLINEIDSYLYFVRFVFRPETFRFFYLHSIFLSNMSVKQKSFPTAEPFQLIPLAAAVCAALSGSPAWAQDDYTELDTTVVSAAGYAQDVREAPASVSVIDAENLATRPVRDIGTAVGDVPGVDIDTTKMGNATISIRGFDAGYTLILTDGRRQNFSDAMMDHGFDPTTAFLPPLGMIERIEVLRGPASTIWGSDAVGGLVNVITKKHVKEFTGNVSIDATLQEHRKEYGNRGSAGFYFGIPMLENRLSLMLRGRYAYNEDVGMTQPNGNFASHSNTEGYASNFGARLNWSVNPQNFAFADVEYARFSGGSMSTSKNSIKAQRWYNKYNVALGHEGDYSFGRTETYLSWNALQMVKTKTSRTSASKPGAVPGEKHGSWSDPLKETMTYTLASKVILPYDYGTWGSMNLTVGVEGNYEFFQDFNAASPAGRALFDQTILAGFAEAEYFINDHWNATAGARVQWSDMFGSHVAPRAYLVYKPADWISFKGGVAAGYKTPNVKQVVDTYTNGTEAGDRIWGNPDLKPEESWSYELSTTVDIGRAAQLTVGGFYTDFKNLIASEEMRGDEYCTTTSCDTHLINHGKVRVRGIEVLFKTSEFYGLSLTGGYTLSDAEIKEGPDAGERPNELPKHSLQLRADYRHGPFSAYVKSTSKWDMNSYDSRAGLGPGKKYKDYTIVDLGTTYQLGKHHRFSVAVNNLLDKDMTDWVLKDTGSYANAYRQYVEGRNYWLSYTYDF